MTPYTEWRYSSTHA